MNILIVSGQWTTDPKAGGVQSSVCTLVEALAKKHAATVFVPRWRNTFLARETHGRFHVYRRRVRYPQGRGLFACKTVLAWIVSLPGTLRDIKRICREQSIEMIHLYQLQPSQASFAVLRFLGGPPYVATFHGRDVRDYKDRPWLERLLIRQIARQSSGFTAVSEELAALAERQIPGVRDVQVIRNGVAEIDVGKPDTALSHSSPLPSRYFLAVGRLYPMNNAPLKGQDLLIRAWSKLHKRLPDLHLLLAGADDERQEYEKLAESCGVADQIHILGSVPRTKLFLLIQGAMGVVTASRSEGGSPTMTILEAGTLGRPLVASSIPAHAEFLEDGVDCLLVPPEAPERIAEAVAGLVEDRALADRLGAALRLKVNQIGSGDQMAEAYVAKAYAPALGGGSF